MSENIHKLYVYCKPEELCDGFVFVICNFHDQIVCYKMVLKDVQKRS